MLLRVFVEGCYRRLEVSYGHRTVMKDMVVWRLLLRQLRSLLKALAGMICGKSSVCMQESSFA